MNCSIGAGGWAGGDEPDGTGVMCATAPIVRPIVQYLMTGADNPEARALCDGLARYVVERGGGLWSRRQLPRPFS